MVGAASVAAQCWLFTMIVRGVLFSSTAPTPLVNSIAMVCSPLLRLVEFISIPSDGFIHRNSSLTGCTG